MRSLIRGLVPSLVLFSCVNVWGATYVVPKDEVLIDRSDAIVIARALHSYVEESTEHGLVTFTVFAVEDVLKGDPSLQNGMRLREPGGAIEIRKGQWKSRVVPGAPRFVDGDRVLLFVRNVSSGDFATTDFGLGAFEMITDDLGHRVVLRDATEIIGRDPDGSLHQEPHRDEDRFLAFIRGIVSQRPVAASYRIEAAPLAGEGQVIAMMGLRPTPLTAFTVTQYTLPSSAQTENALGARWKTFPVNFNRGTNMSNDGNNGSDAVNAAFSAWNGDTNSNVNYVLTSTNANTSGIVDSADGVNNIVFEEDLNACCGVVNFNCQTHGLVGIGGQSASMTDGTNMVNGETFDRLTEVDVSMNKGVNACLPNGQNTFSLADLNSDMTHEVGHTLGFRHSNETRLASLNHSGTLCTTQPSYDCEQSTAIMMSTIPTGLNATLQPWDQRAVAALYPAPLPPTNVLAAAATATSVTITWTASATATKYHVYRTANNSTYTQVNAESTTASPYTDSTAVASTSYFYKVRAVNASGAESDDSNKDLATTVIFTDDPLVVGTTTVNAVHITELRTAVDAVRKLANGGVANNFSYTDTTITPSSTPVNAIHINDLRSAINPARTTLGLTAIAYTDSPTVTATSTTIKAAHIAELRNGVK